MEMYTEGVWAGHPNYECTKCSYKSLYKDKVIEHYTRMHIPPPRPEGVVLLEPKKEVKELVRKKPKKKEVDNAKDSTDAS